MPARLAALSMATWKRGWSTILLCLRPSRAVTWAGMSRHQMMVMTAIGSTPSMDSSEATGGAGSPAATAAIVVASSP